MRTHESRYVADEKVCFWVALNDGGEGAHVSRLRFCGTTVNWNVAARVQRGWRMEDGGQRTEDGGWRTEDGGWRMEDGG
jgi:hypothetical protein